MLNRVFINTLWENNDTGTGVTMSQVSTFVAGELTKGTADLVKIDGTRPMTGNFNVSQNAITNAATILPPNPGDTIVIDGNLNLQNYHLDNVQSLSAVGSNSLRVNNNIEMKGNIDLRTFEVVNPKHLKMTAP